MLVVADEIASAAIAAYNRSADDNKHPGMTRAQLTGDIQQLAAVTITRQEFHPAPSVRFSAKAQPASMTPCSTPVLPIATLPPAYAGKITSPGGGSAVGQGFVVKASVTAIPSGYQLWAVVQVTGPADHPAYTRDSCVATTRVWPGPTPLKLEDASFIGAAFCGGPEDGGLRCRLVLIIADAVASGNLTGYNQTAAANGFRGMLPGEVGGIVGHLDTVDIIRV